MDQNLQIIKRLNDFGVEFVLVGGFAATAYGSSFVTYDVDVCVSFAEPNLSKLTNCIRDIHPRARMRPDKMPIREPLPPNLKNLNLETDLGIIDFLGEISGVGGFAEVFARSIAVELAPEIPCRVIDLNALIDSKVAANRYKDQRHIEELKVIRARQKPSTE